MDGKVKKRYVGTTDPDENLVTPTNKSEEKKLNFNFGRKFFIISGLLLFIVFFFGLFLLIGNII